MRCNKKQIPINFGKIDRVQYWEWIGSTPGYRPSQNNLGRLRSVAVAIHDGDEDNKSGIKAGKHQELTQKDC